MPRPATTQDTSAFRIAKDEHARYGNYLGGHAEMFMDEEEPTTDPAEFARWAFTIATGPIMAPGFITHHERVVTVGWHGDDSYRLALELGLAVPMPPAIVRAVSQTSVRGWKHRTTPWNAHWDAPEDNDRPSVFTTLTCRVPIDPTRLPTPRYAVGNAPRTPTAANAVAEVCGMVNKFVRPILAMLEA